MKGVRLRRWKNRSENARAIGFTNTAKWHACDKAALQWWQTLAPDDVVVRHLEERAPHASSSVFAVPTAADAVGDSACAAKAQDILSSKKLGASGGRGRQGRPGARLEQQAHHHPTWHCHFTGSQMSKGKKPLVRHGPDQASNTSPGMLSSLAVRLEPDKKPNGTSCRADRLPGAGAPGHSLSRDRRTTRPQKEQLTTQSTGTTLPPCSGSTKLCPAEMARQSCNAALRAPAPEAPGHQPRVDRSRCQQRAHTRLTYCALAVG